jgi:hypothetical protein
MTIRLIDGFDLYNGIVANIGLAAKWTNMAGSGTLVGAGRFGGQCMRGWSANPWQRGTVSSTTYSIGVAVRMPNLVITATNYAFLMLANGTISGSCQMGFNITSAGSIVGLRGSFYNSMNTILGTSPTGVITAGTWHYVEVEVTIGTGTSGSFNVYVDNVLVLAVSGVNTAQTGATTTNTIGLMGVCNGNFLEFDDLYVTDTFTRLGERRVETLAVTADTADKDWTPSTGSVNYAMVDEIPVNSTDYVSASTVGDLDLYTIADLSSSPTTIDAVQATMFAEKTDATSRSIAAVFDISATQLTGANHSLAVGISKFDTIFETKPGGGAWDATAVNALTGGPKVTV